MESEGNKKEKVTAVKINLSTMIDAFLKLYEEGADYIDLELKKIWLGLVQSQNTMLSLMMMMMRKN